MKPWTCSSQRDWRREGGAASYMKKKCCIPCRIPTTRGVMDQGLQVLHSDVHHSICPMSPCFLANDWEISKKVHFWTPPMTNFGFRTHFPSPLPPFLHPSTPHPSHTTLTNLLCSTTAIWYASTQHTSWSCYSAPSLFCGLMVFVAPTSPFFFTGISPNLILAHFILFWSLLFVILTVLNIDILFCFPFFLVQQAMFSYKGNLFLEGKKAWKLVGRNSKIKVINLGRILKISQINRKK